MVNGVTDYGLRQVERCNGEGCCCRAEGAVWLEVWKGWESWNERMEKVMDYGLRQVKGVNEEGGRDGVESDGLWARPGARKEWGMLAELV